MEQHTSIRPNPIVERTIEMELTQHGFLEELLAPIRRESWSTYPSGFNEFFPMNNGWSFDPTFEESNQVLVPSSNPLQFSGFSTQTYQPNCECPLLNEQQGSSFPFVSDGSGMLTSVQTEIESSYNNNNDSNTPPFPPQDQDYPSMVEEEEFGNFLGGSETNQTSCLELEESNKNATCKVEMDQQLQQGIGVTSEHGDIIPLAFNMGLCNNGKRSNKSKKIEGQPSKNLMAERRRRKRLNDRLSMLRSIVPKISKMDRTSILGDTIDYMKELLERISKLQEEKIEGNTNQLSLLGINKDMNSTDVLVRNSPKFDVERRDMDTRIDICCAAKPGLLLSTVSTIEALGLEIQQCVISCFNDFSLQASCSEDGDQRTMISSEEIKQALFGNAGYGGRCL